MFLLVMPDIRRFHGFAMARILPLRNAEVTTFPQGDRRDAAMRSLDDFARDKLAALDAAGLRRSPLETTREGIWAVREGRKFLSFSCNDYLNLTQHPAIVAAATEALQRYGIGAGASRLVTGNHPLYAELEARLAGLKGTEAACVFGSGYLANTGIIPALVGASDVILVDSLSHACIHAGAKMSGADVHLYRHNDVAHARELLGRERARHPRAMIATDGVFSMDGDLAPLQQLAALAQEFDAWLLSDDAHGIGVVGKGRGSNFTDGAADVPLQMGTLSKAIGAYGGYLCASQPVIDLMRTRARTLIYSTGLPPPVLAAAIAAIDLIEREPDYAAEPLRKAKLFTRIAALPEAQSAIVPVVIGESEAAMSASALLADEGFMVVAIRPPTVPAGTARLRLAFTAQHPDNDVERLANIVRRRILRR
jgi:8-amino-7-oxononanoate synthase